jgi:hypothetical protein
MESYFPVGVLIISLQAIAPARAPKTRCPKHRFEMLTGITKRSVPSGSSMVVLGRRNHPPNCVTAPMKQGCGLARRHWHALTLPRLPHNRSHRRRMYASGSRATRFRRHGYRLSGLSTRFRPVIGPPAGISQSSEASVSLIVN